MFVDDCNTGEDLLLVGKINVVDIVGHSLRTGEITLKLYRYFNKTGNIIFSTGKYFSTGDK